PAICDAQPDVAIVVWTAFCAELDLPFSFPGSQGRTALYEVTDASIQAAQWAATTASCSGEAFNITNGDVFRWCNLWSSFANFFSLGFAEPRRISLMDFMAHKAPVWDRIVSRHGLRTYAFSDIVSRASPTPF